MKLSVCMITRDEAADGLLDQVLRQVSGCADEIVAVDCSEDDTPAILESHGARVLRRPWLGDHSFQRNISIGFATGDVILVLDADELIDDAFIEQWPDRFTDERVAGWAFPTHHFVNKPGEGLRVNRWQGEHQSWYPDYHIRLFRNRQDIWYRMPLHEELVAPADAVEMVEDIHLYHFGWARDEALLRQKVARRNQQEIESKVKLGGEAPGQHTLEGGPWRDRQRFTGKLPAIFKPESLELRADHGRLSEV